MCHVIVVCAVVCAVVAVMVYDVSKMFSARPIVGTVGFTVVISAANNACLEEIKLEHILTVACVINNRLLLSFSQCIKPTA